MVGPPAFVRSLRFVAGAYVYMLNASCTAIAVPLLYLAAFSTFHRLSWYSPAAAALSLGMVGSVSKVDRAPFSPDYS
jgi:hypothetical protein